MSKQGKKRALISVFYKDGVVELGQALEGLGWEIISTGGTLQTLLNGGVNAIDASEITRFPEILGGRVKTLSPYIFGGLLYRRGMEEDEKTIQEHDIPSIDMVVNVLYPFEETVKDPDASEEDIIEKIDIGGPSMIRAAAKNYKDVLIVTSPDQYERVIQEAKKGFSLEFKKEMAKLAFERTASYDAAISRYFQEDEFPDTLVLNYDKKMDLRYGENPHQKASFYLEPGYEGKLASMRVLQGKELSYNNIRDIEAAANYMPSFSNKPTAIGIKHTNPCAIGSGDDILTAYQGCIAGDADSIFGGIVAINQPLTLDLAQAMDEIFLEIVIAPKVEKRAELVLAQKPNLRVVEMADIGVKNPRPVYTQVQGGLLVQESDDDLYENLEVVSIKEPSQEEMEDLLFAYKAVKCLNSNAIAIVKDGATIGMGIGDVNRFFASSHALNMAGDRARGAVVASDGFFPFADSIQAFDEAGITAIIQPGGSVRDQEIIDYVDQAGIAMVFTGMRHFKH